MAYVPKFSHLFKILLRRTDPAAAEGLFLEGSIEFEAGNHEDALLMFTYGTRLDPGFAGNYYNRAVTLEKRAAPPSACLAAWRDYLAAAQRDPRQKEEARRTARARISELGGEGGGDR